MSSLWRHTFPQYWDRLVSLLFPKTCVFCSDIVAYDTLWCGCKAPFIDPSLCPLCGDEKQYCFKDACHSFSFLRLYSPLYYKDGPRQAVLTLKATPDPRIAAFFADCMLKKLQPALDELALSCVTSVPATQGTLQSKGFNHAEVIAKALAEKLSLPYQGNLLVRKESSEQQHLLNSEERLVNARQSYGINRQQNFALNGRVLLVDDVCTTGATLQACSKQLLRLGAQRVYAATATRYLEPTTF